MCAPDAPDTSKMQEAAVKSAELGDKAYQWYVDQYAEQAPTREAAAARAQAVSDAQLRAMNTSTELAQDYADYNKSTFRPVEQGIVRDAMNYDTAAETERRAGLSGADVAQAFGAQRDVLRRDMGRDQVNPADGRYAGMQRELAASEGLARSFAMNKTRADSETLGRAMKLDAASLGRNLPSQQTAAATTAINAGNASASNGMTPLQIAQAGTAQMGTGFQTAGNLNQSAGNLWGSAASLQNQAGAGGNAIWGGLGSAAGGFLGGSGFAEMIKSDENAKKDITPVSQEDALEAVTATPVKEWTYKRGEGDGGSHIGAMAQDVRRTMGSKVAPGGRMVDMISALGVSMAAIQGLNKKIDSLAAEMGVPV